MEFFSDRRFCRVNEQPESGCLHKQRPSAQTRALKDHSQLTAYIVQTDTLFGAGHARLMYTIKGKTGERRASELRLKARSVGVFLFCDESRVNSASLFSFTLQLTLTCDGTMKFAHTFIVLCSVLRRRRTIVARRSQFCHANALFSFPVRSRQAV